MINQTYSLATSFSISIPGDEYSDLQMNLTNFKIPNVSSNSVEQGTRYLMGKHPGSQLKFEPLSLDLIVNNGLNNIIPVYNWLVNNVITNDLVRKDIRLTGYAANDSESFHMDFIAAFPTNINIDKFDSTSEAILKANITFDYDYYKFG